jgi:hypothetical protein
MDGAQSKPVADGALITEQVVNGKQVAKSEQAWDEEDQQEPMKWIEYLGGNEVFQNAMEALKQAAEKVVM